MGVFLALVLGVLQLSSVLCIQDGGRTGELAVLSMREHSEPFDVSLTWAQYMTAGVDQGQCNSCYVFAALGVLEARLAISNNQTSPRKLSAQQVIDCAQWDRISSLSFSHPPSVPLSRSVLYRGGSRGCATGEPTAVFQYAIDEGILYEEEYARAYDPTQTALTTPTISEIEASEGAQVTGPSDRESKEKNMQKSYESRRVLRGIEDGEQDMPPPVYAQPNNRAVWAISGSTNRASANGRTQPCEEREVQPQKASDEYNDTNGQSRNETIGDRHNGINSDSSECERDSTCARSHFQYDSVVPVDVSAAFAEAKGHLALSTFNSSEDTSENTRNVSSGENTHKKNAVSGAQCLLFSTTVDQQTGLKLPPGTAIRRPSGEKQILEGLQTGPVAAGTHMSITRLSKAQRNFDSRGILSRSCEAGPNKHALIIVGYGEALGGEPTAERHTKFWIVKNSYGNPVYFKVPRGVNWCGIESTVSYPELG